MSRYPTVSCTSGRFVRKYLSDKKQKAKDHVVVNVVESMGHAINVVGIAKLIACNTTVALALTSFVDACKWILIVRVYQHSH